MRRNKFYCNKINYITHCPRAIAEGLQHFNEWNSVCETWDENKSLHSGQRRFLFFFFSLKAPGMHSHFNHAEPECAHNGHGNSRSPLIFSCSPNVKLFEQKLIVLLASSCLHFCWPWPGLAQKPSFGATHSSSSPPQQL
jgi:hypothetical protein